MPPKSHAKEREPEEKEDEPVLQAVVLADSYNQHFQPLTLDTPRCLLPLCNVPLLQWTLESLASAGVNEVIVFCTTKADMVRNAINSWTSSGLFSTLHISTIASSSALSVGDALRELDGQKIIKSDFVLLSGDVVSNLNLMDAVKAHRERRKVSKECIMTLVVKESATDTRHRPVAASSAFVLSPEQQLLHYEPIGAVPRKRMLTLPNKIIEQHEEIRLRNDLIDCGIDICSVDIPPLFTENFDYQSIRLDFLSGILQSEILSAKIHIHFAGNGYAARVNDTRAYDVVSRDVLARETFPLVPDGNLPGAKAGETYELRQMGLYFGQDAILSRTCVIEKKSLIGSHSRIEDDSRVTASIIGKNVVVGPSCTIANSYLWDGVTVGEGSRIESAIIGKGVSIGKGAIVEEGCLIGDHVRIGDGARLAKFSKVGRRAWKEDDYSDDETDDEGDDGFTMETREAILGTGHEGFIWPEDSFDPSDSASEISDVFEHPPNRTLLQLGRQTAHIALSDSSGTLSVLSGSSLASSPALSTTSLPDEEGGGRSMLPKSATGLTLVVERGDEPKFREECIATLDHAFEKGGAVDTESLDFAALQVKGARSTTNVGPGIVREVVLGYLLEKIKGVREAGPAVVVRDNATKLFKTWGPLLDRFAESTEEKVEVLQYLQRLCIASAELRPYYAPFLVSLYNADVVEASDLLAWYMHAGSRDGPEMEKLCKSTMGFVQSCQDDSDEDESEEDDSE